MSENLNGLFVETDKDAVRNSARSLAGTAQLTANAMEVADHILKTVEANLNNYKEMFAASKSDHGAMDALIDRAYPLTQINIEFIKALDEETIDGMLKSQQSKRSRAKSKPMTMDNYKNMLVGAIGEKLIRLAIEKPKQAMSRRFAGTLDFTEDQLKMLADDQNLLRKEIRNIQSRKSIMKSKEGFSEEDEGWLKLLEAETKLKALRTEIKPDTTKAQLATLLGDVDISSMKAADAKALLEKAQCIINPQTVKEEAVNE